MGGKKRGLKRNTSDSANDMSDWSTQRNKSLNFKNIPKKKKGPPSKGGGGSGSGSGSAARPGKRKRQQGWTTSGGKKVKRQRTGT